MVVEAVCLLEQDSPGGSGVVAIKDGSAQLKLNGFCSAGCLWCLVC